MACCNKAHQRERSGYSIPCTLHAIDRMQRPIKKEVAKLKQAQKEHGVDHDGPTPCLYLC